MDQIFNRLERLIKSWISLDEDGTAPYSPFQGGRPRGGSGDPDFDAAMSELDDMLGADRTATEQREAEERRRREAERRRAEEAARTRERTGRSDGSRGSSGHATAAEARRALDEAYRTLGVAPGTPLPEVKAAYKKLLKLNHPDLNAQTPERLKRATEISSRINVAFQLIEAWEESGRRQVG